MAAVEYSPVDLRVMFPLPHGPDPPADPEEQLELAQIDAAEKAERVPQEQLQ